MGEGATKCPPATPVPRFCPRFARPAAHVSNPRPNRSRPLPRCSFFHRCGGTKYLRYRTMLTPTGACRSRTNTTRSMLASRIKTQAASGKCHALRLKAKANTALENRAGSRLGQLAHVEQVNSEPAAAAHRTSISVRRWLYFASRKTSVRLALRVAWVRLLHLVASAGSLCPRTHHHRDCHHAASLDPFTRTQPSTVQHRPRPLTTGRCWRTRSTRQRM